MEFLYMLLDMVLIYYADTNDIFINVLYIIAGSAVFACFAISTIMGANKGLKKELSGLCSGKFVDEESYNKERDFNIKLLKFSIIVLIITTLLLVLLPRRHTIDNMIKVYNGDIRVIKR